MIGSDQIKHINEAVWSDDNLDFLSQMLDFLCQSVDGGEPLL